MVSKKVIVRNKSGIHARPAGALAKTALDLKSDIKLIYGNKTVEAKSILNLMAAAIKQGEEIEVRCEGETEEEDLRIIADFIESGLEEND